MKYNLELITPKILAVVVPDSYDRAMLFCRSQEFYESANVRFKGNHFSIWDYLKWHEAEYKESYTIRWEGFNVPFETMIKSSMRHETIYDDDILAIIRQFAGSKVEYVVGVDALQSDICTHELAHALYATDEAYMNAMDAEISQLSANSLDILYKYLVNEGYHPEKIPDEIQAYFVSGSEDLPYLNGWEDSKRKFKEIFATFAKWQK